MVVEAARPLGAARPTAGDPAVVIAAQWVPQRPDGMTTFVALLGGEALPDLTASTSGASWGESGGESLAVTVELDGEYAGNVFLYAGEEQFTYPVAPP